MHPELKNPASLLENHPAAHRGTAFRITRRLSGQRHGPARGEAACCSSSAPRGMDRRRQDEKTFQGLPSWVPSSSAVV